jgi:hypothetical protein
VTVTNHGPSPASVVARTDTWSTTVATKQPWATCDPDTRRADPDTTPRVTALNAHICRVVRAILLDMQVIVRLLDTNEQRLDCLHDQALCEPLAVR